MTIRNYKMRTYKHKTSVNIGYVIDYIIKERKSPKWCRQHHTEGYYL